MSTFIIAECGSRFWPLVEKGDGCWLWKGKFTPNGYGQFRLEQKRNSRRTSAHRVAYELIYGAIPEGMYVCHHCDNPPCVRPDHLFVGTPKDNVDDMIRKGRKVQVNLRGVEHGRAILSPALVQKIRSLWADGRKSYVGPNGKKHTLGKYPKRAIAEKLGLTYSLVVSALNNWRVA